ncbi:MAG: hypothetical protein NWE85_06470 [Candidatus Bathyarchaeota archaeon]|nr:hypothetical protein [Candidatus Bathyarchaeota archaeon]
MKKPKGKYWSVYAGLALLFSAVSIGTFVLHTFQLSRMFLINFEIGFWVASIAFLFLILSLLAYLKKQGNCGQKSQRKEDFRAALSPFLA